MSLAPTSAARVKTPDQRAKLFDKLCSCCVVLQGVHEPLEFVDQDRHGLRGGRRLGCLARLPIIPASTTDMDPELPL